jgi:hypothetical protein
MSSNNLVDNFKLKTGSRSACNGCFLRKQSASTHKSRSETRNVKPGEAVHSDVLDTGQISCDGNLYLVTFKCESSAYLIRDENFSGEPELKAQQVGYGNERKRTFLDKSDLLDEPPRKRGRPKESKNNEKWKEFLEEKPSQIETRHSRKEAMIAHRESARDPASY